MAENTEKSYLGKGWSFPPTFSKASKAVSTVSEETDINQSIEILLSTTVGERIMQPEYGCNLYRMMFEPMNNSMRTFFKNMIQRAFLFYESRVILEDVGFEVNQAEGMIRINLKYTVIQTNNRYNFVYPFYLNEGTNISQ